MFDKVVFVSPELKIGTPVYERVMAYKAYFENARGISSFDFLNADRDAVIRYAIRSNKAKTLFVISMPSFRNWALFMIPALKVFLDIRDGWSIAQADGYGGLVKRKKVKAWLSKKIERFAIVRAYLTVTCTLGLKEYLEKISGSNIVLIPNGISSSRLELIQKKNCPNHDRSNFDHSVITFVCAGKFSEYGIENAKMLLNVITRRYSGVNLKVKLIGSCPKRNAWVSNFFGRISNGRGSVDILPRASENELFSIMQGSNYGLVLLRDPGYEFGTKVYDYIALGLPIVNYFNEPNNFTRYFDACLDRPLSENSVIPEIRRDILIAHALESVRFE